MKAIANIAATVGIGWIAYFWLGVLWYPRIRFSMPNLNRVVELTLLSAALCALAGKVVSRRWWAGIAAALITLLIIYARVRP